MSPQVLGNMLQAHCRWILDRWNFMVEGRLFLGYCLFGSQCNFGSEIWVLQPRVLNLWIICKQATSTKSATWIRVSRFSLEIGSNWCSIPMWRSMLRLCRRFSKYWGKVLFQEFFAFSNLFSNWIEISRYFVFLNNAVNEFLFHNVPIFVPFLFSFELGFGLVKGFMTA